MLIDGIYLDGKTSKRVKARLEVLLDQRSVHLHLDHDTLHSARLPIAFNTLNISPPLGNTPREISLSAGQLFITEDFNAIDEILKHQAPFSSNLIHKLESNLILVLFSTIATAALIGLLMTQGIPLAAKTIAFNMPEIASIKMASSLTILDKTLFDPSELEADKQESLRKLLSPYITSFSELHPILEFRQGMGANAFALPGGEIILTDDFVNLTDNDEELIAVFFHEMGHLQYKHIVRRAIQDSMITLLTIIITGDLDTVDMLDRKSVV